MLVVDVNSLKRILISTPYCNIYPYICPGLVTYNDEGSFSEFELPKSPSNKFNVRYIRNTSIGYPFSPSNRKLNPLNPGMLKYYTFE